MVIICSRITVSHHFIKQFKIFSEIWLQQNQDWVSNQRMARPPSLTQKLKALLELGLDESAMLLRFAYRTITSLMRSVISEIWCGGHNISSYHPGTLHCCSYLPVHINISWDVLWLMFQYKEEVSSHREGVDPGGSVATTVHKTTNTVLLISKPCTPAEVMQLALTCSKLLMFSGEEKTAADILTNIIKWCHMVSNRCHDNWV